MENETKNSEFSKARGTSEGKKIYSTSSLNFILFFIHCIHLRVISLFQIKVRLQSIKTLA